MRLNEMLIAAVIEGDPEAEVLATELIAGIKIVDLTEEQAASLASINRRWKSEE